MLVMFSGSNLTRLTVVEVDTAQSFETCNTTCTNTMESHLPLKSLVMFQPSKGLPQANSASCIALVQIFF